MENVENNIFAEIKEKIHEDTNLYSYNPIISACFVILTKYCRTEKE